MPRSPRSSTVFSNALRSLLVLASLSLGLPGCQTLGDSADTSSKEATALEADKALVRNALDAGKPEQAMKTLRDEHGMSVAESLTWFAKHPPHFQRQLDDGGMKYVEREYVPQAS